MGSGKWGAAEAPLRRAPSARRTNTSATTTRTRAAGSAPRRSAPWRWWPRRTWATAPSPRSVFDNRIDGLITLTGDSTALRFENAGRIHSRGFELGGEWRRPSGLRARLSCVFQRTTDVATGRELTNSPSQVAKADLDLPLASRRAWVGVNAQYVGTAADPWRATPARPPPGGPQPHASGGRAGPRRERQPLQRDGRALFGPRLGRTRPGRPGPGRPQLPGEGDVAVLRLPGAALLLADAGHGRPRPVRGRLGGASRSRPPSCTTSCVSSSGRAPRSLESPRTVCVVGTDPFGPALDRALGGKSLAGRPLVVRRLDGASGRHALRDPVHARLRHARVAEGPGRPCGASGAHGRRLPRLRGRGWRRRLLHRGQPSPLRGQPASRRTRRGLRLSSRLLDLAAAVDGRRAER